MKLLRAWFSNVACHLLLSASSFLNPGLFVVLATTCTAHSATYRRGRGVYAQQARGSFVSLSLWCWLCLYCTWERDIDSLCVCLRAGNSWRHREILSSMWVRRGHFTPLGSPESHVKLIISCCLKSMEPPAPLPKPGYGYTEFSSLSKIEFEVRWREGGHASTSSQVESDWETILGFDTTNPFSHHWQKISVFCIKTAVNSCCIVERFLYWLYLLN